MIIPLPGGAQIDTGNDPTVVYADDGAITLHTPLALLRLIERWKDKPNLAAILASYTDQLQLLENVLWDIVTLRLPDYAFGVQLDAIGRIVGEPRQGLNDAQYRARIKVRVRINQSFGTAVDIIEVLQMLDAATFTYAEPGHAYFEVTYTSIPSVAVETQIPKIVSQTRAAGVGAVVIFPTDLTTGFKNGTVRAATFNQHIGYGSTRTAAVGGLLAHVAKA